MRSQLSGTIPSTYVSLVWLAIAYNPFIVGALPVGFGTNKLYAFSTYHNDYFSAAAVTATASYGTPLGYGTGVLYGTSIGLDRPMVSILRDVQAALDPSNTSALRTSWGTWHQQPCPPFTVTGGGAGLPQRTNSSTYGRSWMGVTCQEWDRSNTALSIFGAVGGVTLTGFNLTGTLPVQLRELRQATAITVSRNAISGTIPPCWCVIARMLTILREQR